jgi:glyoxylase-like metal-dependent hydrolase (beta-lactamase superfamily II)
MNKRVILLAVLGAALAGGSLYGQFPTGPSKLATIKVRDDLFVIHNAFVPGNSTVLVTSEGVILVDDKFPQDVDNILAEIKTVTNQPVRYVVNTHHHGDHSGGNARLQMMNVDVVATEAARQHFVDAKQPGVPTMTFDQTAYLQLGGKRVELYHFGRAHTSGDLVAFFPAQRALAAGDMFTFGADVPQLIDYAGGGSAKEWPRTLDRVLQLDFDAVVPGHGNVTTKAELRKFRENADRLRSRVREMILKKASRAEVEKMLRSEFSFADLHIGRSLDGLLTELQ